MMRKENKFAARKTATVISRMIDFTASMIMIQYRLFLVVLDLLSCHSCGAVQGPFIAIWLA
jgi:hypothetical protein